MSKVQRIMIIGGPGSGKSTLARQLGRLAGLPVVHLDQLFFRPGWVEVSKPEMNDRAIKAAQAPAWVIDGNYSGSWPYRVSRAQLIIFLDMPRGLRMRRILWRTVQSWGRVRPDMAEGCPERFDRDFLDYAVNYDRDTRPKQARLIETCRQQGHPRCVVLRNPRAVTWFLKNYAKHFAKTQAA